MSIKDEARSLSYRPTYGANYTYSHFPKHIQQILDKESLSCSNRPSYEDYNLQGYNPSLVSRRWSMLLWNYLIKNEAHKFLKGFVRYYGYRRKYSDRKNFDSMLLKNLKFDKWIFKNGVFCAPSEITLDQFHQLGYKAYSELELSLGFCLKPEVEPIIEEPETALYDDEELELMQEAKRNGIDLKSELRRLISSSANFGTNSSVPSFEVNIDSDREIPESILDNIDSLVSITETYGEENLSYLIEHEADIIDYIDTLDTPKSMVRSTIQCIGRLIYEQYLIDNEIPYEKSEGREVVYYDYKINGEEKYITIRTTEKSIIDRNFDIGLRAAQNAFMKEHPNAQFRMVRISISDIHVEPEYKEIVGFFGKEIDPSMDDRFLKKCERLAKNYWKGATVAEFDEVSPEYLIKIERKK